ncbi:MAG: Crp/Fnr family transcriptional regulator [Anaerolineales bacterium]|jgi:CRP/FNR family cyclic AMP-dependent transcriptional regulator
MNAEKLVELPLFQGLNQEHLELLALGVERESYARDALIFAQGERALKLFVLLEGRVAIRYKPYDGDVLPVAEIKPNGVFGWSAALGRQSYTSCALSLDESVMLSMRGETLKQLCEQHPETGVIILERLAEVIAQRLQNTHTHVVELLRNGVKS